MSRIWFKTVARQTLQDNAQHSTGNRIGYLRVSTVSQTLDQQKQALAAAGVTKTFSDTKSGARDDRPGLAELMAYVSEGDTPRPPPGA
jgi:Resolvase, N terminal domain